MPASKIRTFRLILFSVIYLVEGVVLTYISSFNTIYMRSFDISYSIIGLVAAIAMLPYILKIFIGLLSDRVNLFHRGHRKPYIVIGLAMQSVGFFCLSLFSPNSQIAMYVLMMLLIALGMSTYDTTTDGLSIDTTPREDRGIVQGLMVGGRAFGAILSGVLMGSLSNVGQWNMIFYLCAGLGIITLVYSLFVEESQERPADKQFSGEAFKAFKDWGLVLFALIGTVYPLALYATQGLISPFLNESMGVTLNTVGLYTAVYGLGSIVGGVVGGPLMRKFGERNSLLLALAITTAVTVFLAVAPSAGIMWAVVFLFGICFGYYSTIYFALGMEYADQRIAAFMFAVIMAMGNIGISLGSALSGALVDAFSFRPTFFVFAAIHLLVLPMILVLFKMRQKAKTPGAVVSRAK